MTTAQMAQRRTLQKKASQKEERVAARLSAALKKLFRKAATLEGMSLTDFVINSARTAAKRVIQEHELIVLSASERQVFINALLNPPKPNSKLREAFERNQPHKSV